MTPKQSDQELLLKYVKGDPQAFREFYSRYKRPVASYVISLLGNWEDTLEVLQDLFSQMSARANRLAEIQDIKTYLFASARNLSLNYRRKQQRGRNVLARKFMLQLQYEESSEGRRDPDMGRGGALESAMMILNEEEREIVMLHVWEDISFDQLSGIFGKPKSTLHDVYCVAMRKLKSRLSKDKNWN